MGESGRREREGREEKERKSLLLSPLALTALHTHAWMPTLPAGEEELQGQGEHEALPAASLYVPAPHDTHAPPLGPVYPALHKHAWISTLPAGEEELLGQGEHEALPAASLYVSVHQRAASRVVSASCLTLLEVKKA
jgi:hypothetical protein